MLNILDLEQLKAALRSRLCVDCEQRSKDDLPAPPAPARCEEDCAVFSNLQRLARVAREGEPPCGFEVFANSLAATAGKMRSPNLVRALTIMESIAGS